MVQDYFDPLGKVRKLSLVSLIFAISQIQHYLELFILQKSRTGKMKNLLKMSLINKMFLGNPTRNNLSTNDLRFTKNKKDFIEKLLQFQGLYHVSLICN